MHKRVENYETKLVNKVLLNIYNCLWAPLRVILYLLLLTHGYFIYTLYKEESELYSKQGRLIAMVLSFYLLTHIFILMHLVISKKSSRVLTPQFEDIDKRFSKEELSKMSPELKKLLSFSDKTEGDLKTFLNTGERECEISRCNYCNDVKFYSMSH